MEEGVKELGNEHRKVVTNVCPSRVHWQLECKKRELGEIRRCYIEERIKQAENEFCKAVTNVCTSRVHWQLECKKREKVAQEDKYWYQLYCGNRTI